MKANLCALFAILFFISFFITGAAQAAEPYIVFPSDGDNVGRYFGTAIGIHDETMVVGARAMPVGENYGQGAAYVYVFSGRGISEPDWQEVAKLVAPDGATGDRFGTRVAIEDDVIVVSAPRAAVDGIVEAGAVYVFHRSGASNHWRQAAKLTAADPTTMARFGAGIDIDAGRIVASAPGADSELGQSVGAVYLFEHDANPSSWQQRAKLKASDDIEGAVFGASVALSGNTLAIGRTGEDAIHLYEANASGWQLDATLTPELDDHRPLIGGSVALEGDTLAIPAPGEVPEGYNENWWDVGVVHVFERSAGDWQRTGTLVAQNPYIFNRFGSYIALQDDYIAVGEDYEGYELSVFGRNSTGNRERVIRMPFGFSRDGKGVAVSGQWLANGHPEAQPAWPEGSPRGAVHIHAMDALLDSE